MTAVEDVPFQEQQSESDWRALVISSFEELALAAGSDSTTLDELLRLVGGHLCGLLQVNRCSVYLRREDGRFQGQVGYCTNHLNIDAKVSRLVSGLDRFTSEIVQASSPVVVYDASSDARTVQRTMRKWAVKDMLGVPMVVDDEVIGIIYVDDRAENHTFTNRDIRLAKSFAGLAAFVVKQTWQQERFTRQTKVLDKERRALRGVSDIRRMVINSMKAGASIDEILQLVADLLDKPVVMYGDHFDVRSWARPSTVPKPESPALNLDQAEHPSFLQVRAKLDHGASSVLMRATPDLRCRRLFARLTAAEESLGYLELCELGSAFGSADAKVLEELAESISLKIFLERQIGVFRSVAREEYFTDLLYGRRDAEVLTAQAQAFGLNPDKDHFVLYMASDHDPAVESSALAGREHPGKELSAAFTPFAQLVGEATSTEHLLTIFEIQGSGVGHADMRQVLEEGYRSRVDPISGLGVFSQVCTKLHEIPEAVRRVLGVADLLRPYPSTEPKVAFAKEFEFIRLVSQEDGIKGPLKPADQVLRPLLEYDRNSGSDLVGTLDAFIESGAQYRATAARLNVHENTVRYRMNRITEISSIDPNNFQDLALALFAFQVERLTSLRTSRTSPHRR